MVGASTAGTADAMRAARARELGAAAPTVFGLRTAADTNGGSERFRASIMPPTIRDPSAPRFVLQITFGPDHDKRPRIRRCAPRNPGHAFAHIRPNRTLTGCTESRTE